MSFKQAKNLILKVIEDFFEMPETVALTRHSLKSSVRDIYFRVLPTVYKYKKIGKKNEEKVINQVRRSIDDVDWKFKKARLNRSYKSKIVNFEGRENLLFEQIFEILSTNSKIVSNIILHFKDLPNCSKIMRIFYCYFGGLNYEYHQLLGYNIIEKTEIVYLDYFFNIYINKCLKSYEGSIDDWSQFIRKSRFDFPEIHQYMNGARWTLDNPEMRKYAFLTLEKMAKIMVNSKVNSETTDYEFFRSDRKRIEGCKSSRYLLSLKVLEDVTTLLKWTRVTSFLNENTYAKEFLKYIVNRVENYLKIREMDQRNLSFFLIHFLLYMVLIPQCARICNSLLFKNDLSNKFFYLTEDWTSPPFEVSYLETQARTLSIYQEMLDMFNSVMPSLLICLFDKEEKNKIKVEEIIDFSMKNYKEYIQTFSTYEKRYIQCSPYLDKVCLIPVKEFFYLYKTLKKISSEMKGNWNNDKFPKTNALIEVLIDEVVNESSQIEAILGNLLKLTLDKSTDIFIIVTSNMSSLYNSTNYHLFKSEFLYFLMIKDKFLERYNESFEKMAYQIIEAFDHDIDNDEIRRTPLLVNDKRDPCQFLSQTMNFGDDFQEIVERLIDNLTIFFLWKKLSPSDRFSDFDKMVPKVGDNNEFLVNYLEELKRYDKICRCLKRDNIFVSDKMINLNQDLEFVEKFYLMSFYNK